MVLCDYKPGTIKETEEQNDNIGLFVVVLCMCVHG